MLGYLCRMHFDEDFIERCLDNDSKCQGELYKHFAPKMFGICLRYAKNQMEAEDVLQDGFIKVFRYYRLLKRFGLSRFYLNYYLKNEASWNINKIYIKLIILTNSSIIKYNKLDYYMICIILQLITNICKIT